jgi:hypothetical protein
MRPILHQSALTVIFTASIYGILLGISFLVAPPADRVGWMDVWDMNGLLFTTAPKYAYLGRDALNVANPKVLLIGASNMGVGLRQQDVQRLVPCAKASNLSLGGANISELREMVDLVQQVQSPAARQTNTVVLGVWFGMFVDSEQNWPAQHGETDLDIERYRYGFERRTANGPVAVLPPNWLHGGVTVIRPYLLLERVARHLSSYLRAGLFAKPPRLNDEETEKEQLDEAGRKQALMLWRQIMGPKNDIALSQINTLQSLIVDLLSTGNSVFLVDMPIPAWHRAASPWQASYVQALEATVKRFAGRPGFEFIRTDDLTADDNFADEVHPKPHLAHALASRLAMSLNPLICDGTQPRPQVGASTAGISR